MTLNKARIITTFAGLGAFAVVLSGAAFWREIVCAVYPKARLWGKWEYRSASATDDPLTESSRLIYEFTSSGEHRQYFQDLVTLKTFPLYPLVQRYRVEANTILFLDDLSETKSSLNYSIGERHLLVWQDRRFKYTLKRLKEPPSNRN